jgi:carbonic anhydrase
MKTQIDITQDVDAVKKSIAGHYKGLSTSIDAGLFKTKNEAKSRYIIKEPKIGKNISLPRPDLALQQLLDGNARFVGATPSHPHQDGNHRISLGKGQAPFAAILSCADSRVPPEVLFDQGLGDLFVVRVAGNILNDQILGSLEYAAGHLNTPLIMVLGHTKCGAVGAVAMGAELEGHIASLAPAIQPAVDKVKDQEGDLTDNASREVARMTAEQMINSEPIMANLVKENKVKIVPAFYDLESGEVALL